MNTFTEDPTAAIIEGAVKGQNFSLDLVTREQFDKVRHAAYKSPSVVRVHSYDPLPDFIKFRSGGWIRLNSLKADGDTRNTTLTDETDVVCMSSHPIEDHVCASDLTKAQREDFAASLPK